MHTLTDPAVLRSQLVDELVEAGALRSLGWIDAFGIVPRHAFITNLYRRGEGGLTRLDRADPNWLPTVYSNISLVTQVNAAGMATSSSTQPVVMALMLEALNVRDGHRVLEIGTGTGYNAALLSHRLGDDQVVSVDVDEPLVVAAHVALDAAGYRPTLATVDGRGGYAAAAPYDRVIATCAVTRVPTAWIDQTLTGGRVLANLGYGTIGLDVQADRSAVGRFLPDGAAFIHARAANEGGPLTPAAVLELCRNAHEEPEVARIDIRDLRDPECEWFAQLFVGELARVSIPNEPGGPVDCMVHAATGSWARVQACDDHTVKVHQAGPRRLWDEHHAAFRTWVAAGRPAHEQLGLTVTLSGEHHVWVDDPGRGSWPLPSHTC